MKLATISKEQMAKIIDPALVKATATKTDVEKLCKETIKHDFGCVVINPTYVKLAPYLLRNFNVKVCSTVGFPFGAALQEIKAL